MSLLNPESWIANYGDYLFNYARIRLPDNETAEDVVQETLLSAWRGRKNFKGNSSEKTWLLSILKNKIIDHFRKTLIKGEQEGRKETPLSFFNTDGTWQPETVGTDWNMLASAELESKEFFAVFQKCVDALTGKGLEAFSLKYLEDLDSENICKALNITPSNFWVIIHRAKLQLRKCLDTNWFNQL